MITQLRRPNKSAIAHLSAQYYLGANLQARGNFVTEHDVYLDCDFEGAIISEGLVEIDVNARVKANISARAMNVSGFFEGQAEVRERFNAIASATLRGSITAANLQIDQGAIVAANITSQPRDNR